MTRIVLIPTLFLLLIGLGCFWISAAPSSAGEVEKPIVFCIGDDIQTLDPDRMAWMNDIRVAMGLWEGLTAYDPKTLKPVPGMAQRWEISPDRKTYTFHLRADAKWSDDTAEKPDPVTAGDFLFGWKRMLTPATGAEYIGLFKGVVGAEEFTGSFDWWWTHKAWSGMWGQRARDFSMVGMKAPDAKTIVVTLKAPCGYFLDLCAFPPFFPLNEKAMAAFFRDRAHPEAGYDGAWARPPNIVCDGPYIATAWKFQQYLTLEPNPRYWDRAHVRCPRLLIKTISDSRTALLAYQQGAVDVVTFPTNPQFGEDLLRQRDAGLRHDVHFGNVFGTYYYVFNCTRKPFDDKRVRKALALAIDKEKIVRDVTRLNQLPVGVIVPPGQIPGYTSPAGLPMDVAEARRLMAEAGFPGGKGFPTMSILYTKEVATHGFVALAIAQMWEENLGVRCTYEGLERSSFGQARQSQDFDIARGGWYGDYADPTTWLDLLRTDDGNNDGKFSDSAYDALLNQAAAEPDAAKRMALLSQAEGILVHDEFPLIPLYEYADGLIFDPEKIAGVSLNDRQITPLKWIHRRGGERAGKSQ